MEIMYSSEVTSKGGLYGHVTSKDGALDTDVYMPTGTEPDKQKGTTPEQLFAASYAACLEGTIYYVAQFNNIKIDNTQVTAKIKAVQAEKGDLRFALDLNVTIPDIDKKEAQRLLDEAYENCPLTKATAGKMEINLSLV